MQRHGRIHCGRRELNLQMIGSTVCNPSCFIYDKPLHAYTCVFISYDFYIIANENSAAHMHCC